MLELPGFKGLKKILWKQISPGVIVISGAKVNNTTPPELFNYPILNAGLIYEITKKYHFRDGKEVIIAEVEKGISPEKLATSLRTLEKRILTVNEFRKYLFDKKKTLSESFQKEELLNKKIIESEFVVQSETILNLFNSFDVKFKGFKTPSIFNKLSETVTLLDVFNKNTTKKFDFPEDRQVVVHVVIEYSKEMYESKSLKDSLLALETLKKFLLECNLNYQLLVYGFSEECNPLQFPLSERDMERRGRKYSSFQKKILRHKKTNSTNKVILISSGPPDDFIDAIETGGKMKRGGIDYSQVILSSHPSRQNLEKWKAICMTCSGNQVVLTDKTFLELVLLEVIDIYLGNLSLANKIIQEPTFVEFSKPLNSFQKSEEVAKKRVVKPFEFKKL